MRVLSLTSKLKYPKMGVPKSFRFESVFLSQRDSVLCFCPFLLCGMKRRVWSKLLGIKIIH